MSSRIEGPGRVFLTADAVGGVWQYSIDLAKGLRARGVATTLAVLGPQPSGAQRLAAESIPDLTLIETGLPLDWTASDSRELIWSAEALMQLARGSGAEIAQVNGAAMVSREPGLPVVAVQHSCTATWWGSVRTGDLPADFRWRRDAVAAGLRNSDVVVTPTRAFAEATRAAYSLPRLPTVVRNGRSRGQLPPRTEGAVFAFTAGRLWDDGKDIATLDRAAEGLGVPVVAAGPLSHQAGSRMEPRHLRVLGSLAEDEVARWLAERPIYVSTALYEPFGLAVLEAAQAGCALVLSDIATLRELWDGAAVFVPPGDALGFAAALRTLATDEVQRAQRGEAAAARSRRYTVELMVEGMLDIYYSLCAARTGLRIVA